MNHTKHEKRSLLPLVLFAVLTTGTVGQSQSTQLLGPRWSTRRANPSIDSLFSAGTPAPSASPSSDLCPECCHLAVSNWPSIAETITPEIAALARGLLNDPKTIYNYVH